MPEETRTGVRLTNLDQPLFDDAGADKRHLVDYLDAVADRIVPVLAGRALSVVRVLRGHSGIVIPHNHTNQFLKINLSHSLSLSPDSG